MLDNKKKLQEENKELKKEIKELRRQLNYYNERVKLIDEKEKKIDTMLSHLEKQKVMYQNVIGEAKMLRDQIKEYTK